MAADPTHKAMLYFLELLLNSNSVHGPNAQGVPLAALLSRLELSEDMRLAILQVAQSKHEQPNGALSLEQAVPRFLETFPSLFKLSHSSGTRVSLREAKRDHSPSPASSGSNTSSGRHSISAKPGSSSNSKELSNGSAEIEPVPTTYTATTANKLPSQSNSNAEPAQGKSLLERLEAEAEAVKFFESWLARRDEKWIHWRSLAGNLHPTSITILLCFLC